MALIQNKQAVNNGEKSGHSLFQCLNLVMERDSMEAQMHQDDCQGTRILKMRVQQWQLLLFSHGRFPLSFPSLLSNVH